MTPAAPLPLAAWPLVFLAWPFLLAGLAAAIPVVLHLIHRQKAKQAPFPTLRFLQVSVQKTRRRKRVHDLLLMLIRAAVLVLIALGLARPTVTSLHSLLGGAQSAVVIILDNSTSMGMIDPQRTRFETATGAALQILDELGDGDQVAVLLTGGPLARRPVLLDRSQQAGRQALAQCRVSYERADLPAKIRHARQLLSAADAPSKHIYVITDMQKLSWAGLAEDGESEVPLSGHHEVVVERVGVRGTAERSSSGTSPHPSPLPKGEGTSTSTSPHPNPLPEGEGIPVIIIDCSKAPKPNVAVQGIAVEAPVAVAGVPIKVSVELLNTSDVSQQPSIDLLIDDAKEQTSPVLSVPPLGRVKHDFMVTFRRGGLHRGEARLVGDDGSKFDDRRFFALEIDQAIPVAVVKPKRHEIPYLEDTFYIERAFSPGSSGDWAIRPTPLVADDLRTQPLEQYKVVFCVNLPAPEPDTAQRLRAYVAAGGSLVWIAGDNVEPDAYNRMNDLAHGQLLPAPLVDVRAAGDQPGRNAWHVNSLDAKHPALARLVEPPALYQSVLVYRQVRMAVEKEGVEGIGPSLDTSSRRLTAAEQEERGGPSPDANSRRLTAAGSNAQASQEGTAGSTPATWALARLDDGEALITQRRVEQGKVLMFGTGAHRDWSNLPLRPIFLPLLTRLTFDLAGAEAAQHQSLAGEPLVLPLPGDPRPVGVEILRPTGETIRLRSEDAREGRGQVFRYDDTHEIGLYLLRLMDAARPAQVPCCVNADPEEADPAKIDRDELHVRLGPAPLVFAENPDDLTSTFAMLREGTSLWSTLLWMVLVVLVFETFLSNHLAPKRT